MSGTAGTSGLDRRRTRRAGAVPAAMGLNAMAMGAVHAHRAVAQLLGEHRAELERRAQLHVHSAGQMFLGEQRQRHPVYGLFAETLQTQITQNYSTANVFYPVNNRS